VRTSIPTIFTVGAAIPDLLKKNSFGNKTSYYVFITYRERIQVWTKCHNLWGTIGRNFYYLVREVEDGETQSFVSAFRYRTSVDITSLSTEKQSDRNYWGIVGGLSGRASLNSLQKRCFTSKEFHIYELKFQCPDLMPPCRE
jgi:hypothetical protein